MVNKFVRCTGHDLDKSPECNHVQFLISADTGAQRYTYRVFFEPFIPFAVCFRDMYLQFYR